MIIRDNGQTGMAPDPTTPNPGAGYTTAGQDVLPEDDVRDRQPKGDHNRRLALGLDADAFAAAAGVSVEELREYEETRPYHEFDLDVARKIGAALRRLELNPPPTQKVTNGPGI